MSRPCCNASDGQVCADDCFRRKFAEGVHKEAVQRTSKAMATDVPTVERWVDWNYPPPPRDDYGTVNVEYKQQRDIVHHKHIEALRSDPVHVEACQRSNVDHVWLERALKALLVGPWPEPSDLETAYRTSASAYCRHRRDIEREQRIEKQKHEAARRVVMTADALRTVPWFRASCETAARIEAALHYLCSFIGQDKTRSIRDAAEKRAQACPDPNSDTMLELIEEARNQAAAGKPVTLLDEATGKDEMKMNKAVTGADVPHVETQADADRLWGKGAAPDMEAMASVGGKVALVPLKRPKPDKVEVGQRWRCRVVSGVHTVSTIAIGNVGVRVGFDDGWHDYEDRMLSDDDWEYLGVAELEVELDPKASFTVAHLVTLPRPVGARRSANIAEAQRLIADCPVWAYPRGWMLAVMAVAESVNNMRNPGAFATVWGPVAGGPARCEELLHRYHNARREATVETAKQRAAECMCMVDNGARWPIVDTVCDAYERGRR